MNYDKISLNLKYVTIISLICLLSSIEKERTLNMLKQSIKMHMDISLKDKKQHITNQFIQQVGCKPSIDAPKTFNEKIQWLKLYYRNPLMVKCADKYAVRNYVSKAIGRDHLIPLIGVYNNIEDVGFDSLPNEFVLKLNCGSGDLIICKDKYLLDIDDVMLKLGKWLKPEANHYFYSYEWCYKDIKPKILCEKYLNDSNLFDYKFMCFNGKVKLMFVCSERESHLKVDFFDLKWNKLPFRRGYPNSDNIIKAPKNLQVMIKLAEKLAKPFPFVRVDFYEIENKVLFGELTFYPGNGMERFEPVKWDYKLGEYLTLPGRSRHVLSEAPVKTQTKQGRESLSVCFFSHTSQLGGAERSLLELVTELIRDHGVACTVVLPNIGPLKEKLEEVGASTLIAEYSWWCDPNLPPSNEIALRQNNSLISVMEQITQKLETINPDVIFTNTMVIPWGAIAASFLGKPHVWSISEFGQLDHGLRFFFPFEKIPRFIQDSSNAILTRSNAIKKALFGNTIEPNILTVYRHIDIASNALRKDREYFTKADSTKLIIAGTVLKSKGQKDAILAIKELTRRGRKVELIIVGYSDERYLKELKDLVKYENLQRNIQFIDFQENVYPIMSQADIVLVCSQNEAFGRVVLEGMLLKKPVIGTNSGGTPEMIKEGSTGLLYEPGHYMQLAEKIEYLINNRSKIKKLGINGYNFAKKKFTKAEYGGKIYKLLKDLKNEPNPLSSDYSQFLLKNLLSLINTNKATIKDKDVHIENLATEIKNKDTHIGTLDGIIKDKDTHIVTLNDSIKKIESSFSYKAGKLIALPFAAIQEFFDRILIIIKSSFLFNKNRLSQFPEGFGFRGHLDIPQDNEGCTMCSGWFVSKKPLKNVELFIGNKKITDLKRNIRRKDVDIIIHGYKNIKIKGFEYFIPEVILSGLKKKKRTLLIRFYIDDKHYIDKFHTNVRFGIFPASDKERLFAKITTEIKTHGVSAALKRLYWVLTGNVSIFYPLFKKVVRYYFTEELSDACNFMTQLFAELIAQYPNSRVGAWELNRDLQAIAPRKSISVRTENAVIPEIGSKRRLKILYVCGMFPSANHGGGLRLYDILSELSKVHEVDLFSAYNPEADGPYLDQVGKLVKDIKTVPYSYMNSDVLENWLLSIGKGNGYYDVIQLEYPNTINLADKVRKLGKKVGFTFMECTSRRNAIDILLHLNDPTKRSKCTAQFIRNAKAESEISKKVDFTIAVTLRDSAFASKFGGAVPYIIPTGVSRLIMNGATINDIEKPKFSASFVGNFEHAPNIDAMRWYLNNVHPLVKEKIKHYKIEIVGYGNTALLEEMARDDTSVVFSGFVDDLAKHILNSKVCIAPIISGAGIRGKINHSSVLGRPTISTSLGLCGLPYIHEESAMRADSPKDFAESMIRLLTDEVLYRKIQANCRRIAEQYFSWEQQIEKLNAIYHA